MYPRRKRRGEVGGGQGPKSALGKVCLLCMGCLVAGFVGHSIVALLTLNLSERQGGLGGGGGAPS